MKKYWSAKVIKYQGYFIYLKGKLQRRNVEKIKGILKVIQGRLLEAF